MDFYGDFNICYGTYDGSICEEKRYVGIDSGKKGIHTFYKGRILYRVWSLCKNATSILRDEE